MVSVLSLTDDPCRACSDYAVAEQRDIDAAAEAEAEAKRNALTPQLTAKVGVFLRGFIALPLSPPPDVVLPLMGGVFSLVAVPRAVRAALGACGLRGALSTPFLLSLAHVSLLVPASCLFAQLDDWELKSGVQKSVRVLLSTLHTVLWEGSGWKVRAFS